MGLSEVGWHAWPATINSCSLSCSVSYLPTKHSMAGSMTNICNVSLPSDSAEYGLIFPRHLPATA